VTEFNFKNIIFILIKVLFTYFHILEPGHKKPSKKTFFAAILSPLIVRLTKIQLLVVLLLHLPHHDDFNITNIQPHNNT